MNRVLGLTLTAIFSAAILAPTVAVSAPTGGWVGSDARTSTPTANVPTWTRSIAADFPACHAPTANDGLADRVVVLTNGDTARVGFERVAKAAVDAEDGDEMWVVGAC